MFRMFVATVLCCFCAVFNGFAQTIVAQVNNGDWNTAATWNPATVPTSANSSQIRIPVGVNVKVTTAITISQLTVETGGSLEMATGGSITTVATGIIFQNGATYNHNKNDGVLPTATWQTGSTCKVTGWTAAAATTNFQNTLAQSFHHFTWDCPGQTQVNMQFAGKLTTVNGNLTIANTGATGANNRRIVLGLLSGSGTITTTVGGDLAISGGSQVLLGSVGTYTMNVGGDVIFSSTSTGSNNAYTIQGSGSVTTTLNAGRDLTLTSGVLNAVSVGGTGTINITRNLGLTGGTVSKTAGAANINFVGSGTHTYTRGTTTFTANQAINYSVLKDLT